jgi:hypothetical protein
MRSKQRTCASPRSRLGELSASRRLAIPVSLCPLAPESPSEERAHSRGGDRAHPEKTVNIERAANGSHPSHCRKTRSLVRHRLMA